MSKRKSIHDRVLNAENLEELMAAYDEWAAKYDDDLLGEMGYVGPIIIRQEGARCKVCLCKIPS